MSRIECKYCLISNSCLAGFFDIFDSIVCFGDFFLTCDQASLIFFVVAGRYAWYNYLTICLLLVQDLDFSPIGQETKRYLELSHDWLP